MTDKVQDWQRRASENAKNLGETTNKYIRENTWTTVAAVAVLGCILGFLFANRGD